MDPVAVKLVECIREMVLLETRTKGPDIGPKVVFRKLMLANRPLPNEVLLLLNDVLPWTQLEEEWDEEFVAFRKKYNDEHGGTGAYSRAIRKPDFWPESWKMNIGLDHEVNHGNKMEELVDTVAKDLGAKTPRDIYDKKAYIVGLAVQAVENKMLEVTEPGGAGSRSFAEWCDDIVGGWDFDEGSVVTI